MTPELPRTRWYFFFFLILKLANIYIDNYIIYKSRHSYLILIHLIIGASIHCGLVHKTNVEVSRTNEQIANFWDVTHPQKTCKTNQG